MIPGGGKREPRCHACGRIIFRLLDAFCGEGGAAAGYYAALWALGWCPTIVGVDTVASRLQRYEALNDYVSGCPGPSRPFVAVQADALEYTATYGDTFMLGHGSPTCTGYSRGTAAIPGRLEKYDRLIPVWREVAESTGMPYIIENVADARPELREPVMLCGRMFGLSATDDDGTPLVLDRHRLFELPAEVRPPAHLPHDRSLQVAGSYAGARRDKVEARTVRRGGYVPSADVQRALLGVPWMSERGCQLSIPPAYTEWIGRALLTSRAPG